MPNAPRRLSFERITQLVARALGVSAEELQAAFVPAQSAHLAGVMALRRRVLDTPVVWDDAQYLTWRYHFGATTQGRGDCWVLVHHENVIAMVGTERIELLHGTRIIPTLSTMDIAVDLQFADCGLGAWINLQLATQQPCCITVGSNEQSLGMIRSLFASLPNRRNYIHFLDYHRLFLKRLRPKLLANAVAAAAGAATSLWRWLLPGAAIEIRAITRFDRDVDALVARARPLEEVWISRSAEFLNWRLFENPRVQYAVWGAYARGRLVGHIATQLQSTHAPQDALGVVDWLVDPATGRAVAYALLRHVLRQAAEVGVHQVAITANDVRFERQLRWAGFLRQRSVYESVAIFGCDTATVDGLMQMPRWFISEINTDRDGL